MTDRNKHDMRDDARAKTTVTDTDSRMAGGDDQPKTVKPLSDYQEVTPDIGNLPEGQATKG